MSPRDVPPPPAGAFDPSLDRRIGSFHWRGFATLVRRELLRVRKMVAMTVVAPAIMAVIYFTCFTFGLGGSRGTPAGDAVLDFLVPGLIMMSLLLQAAQNPAFSLVYSKIEGMVIDQLMAPVGARETVLAYIIAGVAAGLLAGAGIWAAMLLLRAPAVAHPLAVAGFAVLGAAMMASAGFLSGIVSQKWDHMAAFLTFIFLPLVFLSGLFAPVDGMPEPFRTVVQANPVFYAIDGFRYGFIGESHQPPAVSLLVLLAVTTLLYGAALALYARGWRLKG